MCLTYCAIILTSPCDLFWGIYSVVFRGYSWVCIQELLLAVLGGRQVVPGIETRFVNCKESTKLLYCSGPSTWLFIERNMWPCENAHVKKLFPLVNAAAFYSPSKPSNTMVLFPFHVYCCPLVAITAHSSSTELRRDQKNVQKKVKQ